MESNALHALPCAAGSSDRVGKSRQLIEVIASTVTPAEMALLAQYLFDGMTQTQMKETIGMSQQTVSNRLHVAARKLRLGGIPVKFPGRGRRKRASTSLVAPDAMDRLVTREDDEGTHGKWIDSGKVDRGSA